jgi:glycosyltransferase involved in cell wall biosynthesis
MDSSLSQQIAEKYPNMAKAVPILGVMERVAIQRAQAVAPVCDALVTHVAQYNPTKVVLLRDISLLQGVAPGKAEDLRTKLGIQGALILYVGNLEVYQGIDLLLDSFAQVAQLTPAADVVIIGGETADIEKYRAKCRALGIAQRVHFRGPRPVEHLAAYLSQADILVSPRIKGANTPMKVYSYLDSGRAILATDLPTHTQVLDSRVAMLAEAKTVTFAQALLILINEPEMRQQLGNAGHRLIQDEYSYDAFYTKLNGLYDWIKLQLNVDAGANVVPSTTYMPKQSSGSPANEPHT